MKKITNRCRALAALALCLAAQTAVAQDVIFVDGVEVPVAGTVVVGVDVPELSTYLPGSVEIEYGMEQVLSILGISDIEEAEQYIVNVTTSEAVENTTDSWRDGYGDAATWNTTDNMVCVKIDDPSSGFIDYVGCINSYFEQGEEYDALWAFVAGGKAAIVDVHITFVEDTSAKAPEAELDLTKVTVVGNAECYTERYDYDGFSTESCTVSVPGIASLLGVDASEMEEWIADDVYVAYNNDNAIKIDSLQLLSVTDGWLERCHDDWGELGAGDLLDECCAKTYSSSCYYFIQKPTYDAENDEMSFVVGNYPGNLEEGDSVYSFLYVMNGEKAYVIRHNLYVVEAPDAGGPGEMTKVGEQFAEVTMYPTSDWSYDYIYPELDEAAELLGCSTSDLTLKALANATTFSSNSSANNGGWWFDANGYVETYGNSTPFYIEPRSSGDYTALHIGQYPNYCSAGDVYTTSLYLVYEDKYYLIDVTLTIIEKEPLDWDKLEIVSTTTLLVIQELVEDGYTFSSGEGIPFDKIEEAIGTTDPTLYGELSPEEAEENDGFKYTEDYTCTPYPGFWLTSDGYVATWGSNSVWGMSIAQESSDTELMFNCIQFPGLTAYDDTFSGNFYLLNEDNMKMMGVRLTYVIGETVEYTNVGTSELTIYVTPDEELEYDFGMEEILEALGMTEDDFMDTYCMRAAYGYSSTVTGAEGLSFDLDGKCIAYGGGTVGFWIENGKMWAYSQEDIPEGTSVNVTIFIQYDTSRYTLNITFMSTDDMPEAVAGVMADANANTAIYDLAGRQVAKAQKGVYIQNGKKILVK